MIFLLIILFLTSPCMAKGPKYNFDNPRLNDEMENIYKDIQFSSQFIDVKSVTKAEIQALTPKQAGRLYFCSDCTTDAICVSTGTAIGSFSRLTARTTACQ